MDCAYNIITANFSGGKTHATTARVYQWSRGIELCITGADNLPQTFKAHFSVQKRGGVATTIVGIDERVTVPNVLFTIGKDIHVWLGASETEDDAEILYTVDIPVAPAPMPEYYDAEDTGVFDAVVEQVSGYAATATAAANSAGASATAAAGSASAAAQSASSAAGSAGAAEQARADAVTAKGQAETAAQTATEKALQTAQNASQAALDADRAESAAERAESAESGAGAAKTAAEAAAQSAAASAATADEKATLAGQSATAAAGSASAAAQSAASIEGDVQMASRKAAEAQTAAGQAVIAKDAAVTAQQGAETAATNAGQSSSTATAKASEAAQSASGAAQSKTDAEAAAARAEQAAATLTVDSALSDTSVNPVQNKVITGELTDVKTAIDALKITDTASGAIASFSDGAAMPMESLSVELEPIQDLNGQDAPYPAGGGKNLFDPSAATVGVNWNGNALAYSIASDYIPVVVGETYTLSVSDMPKFTGVVVACLDADKVYKTNTSNTTFTVPTDTAFVRISFRCASDQSWTDSDLSAAKIQFEKGSSASAWSPYENLCPISGRTEVTVERTGKNLFNKTTVTPTRFISADGTLAYSANYAASDYIPVKAGVSMIVSGLTASSAEIKTAFYDREKVFISAVSQNKPTYSFTTPSGAEYARITVPNADIDTAQLEIGSTLSAYAPYDGQSVTVQLGQTVYGGTVDVTTGTMTVEWKSVDMGTLNWNNSKSVQISDMKSNSTVNATVIKCSIYPQDVASVDKSIRTAGSFVAVTDSAYSTGAEFKTAMAGQQLVYPLATPLTVQLTPAQLSTLKGTNNVWSDADSVTVEYVADPKLYISRLTEPDADMIADANITSGYYFMVGNNLYLATANIASGATIVPGVNCTKTNLAAALNAINS